MESGLFLTFFDRGEPAGRELPPVGPLDQVVVRPKQLVSERRAVQQAQELGVSIDRWLEAELELQRATGEEPGGTKRAELRVTARDGVFLRFAVFGEAKERDLVPELGPYAVVHIGQRTVEADGETLATRSASDLATWELASAAGDEFAGLHKPDVAFRTPATGYHPNITPAPARPPVPDTVQRPPPPRRAAPAAAPRVDPAPPGPTAAAQTPPPAPPPEIAREPEPLFREEPRREQPAHRPPPRLEPPAEEPPALTARDLELVQRIERERSEETLRARIQEDERRRLGVDEAGDESATTWAMRYRPQASEDQGADLAGGGTSLSWGAALWRLRFAIIGVLLFAVGVYGLAVVRTGGAPGVPGQVQIKTVGIAQKFSSSRWEYVANGTQRVPTAGAARARGIYYVVRLGVTNRGTEGAQLSPSEFVLIDANGGEHVAESPASDAYYGSGNTQSSYIWPQSFAVGKNVTLPLIFDVDPSLPRGMLLKVADLPATRVKLD